MKWDTRLFIVFQSKGKITRGRRHKPLKTGFAKPAKHRIESSHRNFFFLKSGYKRTKLISEDVGNTNNNTGIKRESLLNRKTKSGLHQTVASVFYSSSNQIYVSSVQPASFWRKTAKIYNRGLFLSRDGCLPNLEVTTFLNDTKSGKSKISEGDPATVIETGPWRSPLCSLHYSCAHYKETSCLLTACPDILFWTHTLHWLNQRKTCSRDPTQAWSHSNAQPLESMHVNHNLGGDPIMAEVRALPVILVIPDLSCVYVQVRSPL